jgi:hypothetical protein
VERTVSQSQKRRYGGVFGSLSIDTQKFDDSECHELVAANYPKSATAEETFL